MLEFDSLSLHRMAENPNRISIAGEVCSLLAFIFAINGEVFCQSIIKKIAAEYPAIETK